MSEARPRVIRIIKLPLWLLIWLLPEIIMANLGGDGHIAGRLFLANRHDLISDGCHAFTGDPLQCRQSKCNFDCGNALCRKERSTCGMASGCADSCFDVCSCRKSGCQYNFGNSQCRNYTDKHCRYNQFFADECGRKDTQYSFGGEICLNKQLRGRCNQDEVVLAVNLQGNAHADVNGIYYQAFADVNLLDPARIIAAHKSSDYSGRGVEDRPLYTSILTATPKGRKPGQCVSYNTPICKDGSYELSVKVLDDVYDKAGKRHFSIKFASQYVFPEIDIFALAGGEKAKALDLNINFQVSQGQLTLRGFPSLPVVNGTNIFVEFCTSECKISNDGKFYVSAFSLIKFFRNNEAGSNSNYCG